MVPLLSIVQQNPKRSAERRPACAYGCGLNEEFASTDPRTSIFLSFNRASQRSGFDGDRVENRGVIFHGPIALHRAAKPEEIG